MLIQTVKLTGLALLLCSLVLVSPITSTVHAANGDAAITLDFKDIELGDLIQTISALTGKNFVYDDTIRGKATIISSEKMTKEEAYQLFLTVMNIKGFTVVPTGKTHKIVATKQASESNVPTYTTASNQDQFVTRMISLKHINAVDIASSLLAPLMPKTSNVVVYQPSNMLIISDNAANIQRLTTIINELDIPGALQETTIIALQYADAKETAKICNDLLVTAPKAARAASKNVTTSTNTKPSKVIPYERTNRLVIMATQDDLKTLKRVIAELDRVPTKEHSRINLYYLENADAETLGQTLNEILTGIKQPKKSATSATTANAPVIAAALSSNISVTADKPTNALIVNSTPEDYLVLKDIIRQLDIRRKQVYVEALIMELSMDATEALGVSLQGGFEIGSSGAGGISTLGGTGTSADVLTNSVNGIMAGGFSKLIEVTDSEGNIVSIPAFSALIDLSETDTNVNILSAPRLLTSDNEEAEIVVGRNVPIITSRLTDSTGSDSLAQSVSVERKDVALTLKFTPQITQGDLVRLNVYQETTDLVEDGTSVGNVNDVGPTFTTRKISNTVLAQDGQTVVLGGLISTNKTDTVKKVPLLGDIPGLGWLFKKTSHDEVKTNLLVFITPTIVKDIDDLSAITISNRQEMDTLREQQAQEPN